MGQTYLDDEAHNILRAVRKEMQEAGMRGATLGDAVRKMKQIYDKMEQGNHRLPATA
jgi:hypothetical protein